MRRIFGVTDCCLLAMRNDGLAFFREGCFTEQDVRRISEVIDPPRNSLQLACLGDLLSILHPPHQINFAQVSRNQHLFSPKVFGSRVILTECAVTFK